MLESVGSRTSHARHMAAASISRVTQVLLSCALSHALLAKCLLQAGLPSSCVMHCFVAEHMLTGHAPQTAPLHSYTVPMFPLLQAAIRASTVTWLSSVPDSHVMLGAVCCWIHLHRAAQSTHADQHAHAMPCAAND